MANPIERLPYMERFLLQTKPGALKDSALESWAFGILFHLNAILDSEAQYILGAESLPLYMRYETQLSSCRRLLDQLQEVADRLDYGPFGQSPRDRQKFSEIVQAFRRACSEQDERCAQGEHRYIRGDPRCRHCRHPKFHVVEGEDP